MKSKNLKENNKEEEDLGLDHEVQKGRQRTINPDGTFNMERKSGKIFGNFNIYRWLKTTSWPNYWLIVFSFYGIMNVFFATIFYLVGPEQINGIQGDTEITKWMYCFFFSAQSFTTVGYGALSPISEITNFIATIEAFIGLMTFALATGTLYGRFSKPVTKIKFSDKIIIAPFRDITGLQFMIANKEDANLMELEARVNISWLENDSAGNPVRKFQQSKLEIDKVTMFPTSWIVNHPIDEESSLYKKSLEEIKASDFEVFILIKGFDDVFSQTIYSRYSYIADNFIFGAKFKRPFYINDKGKMVMDLTKVGDFERIDLNKINFKQPF